MTENENAIADFSKDSKIFSDATKQNASDLINNGSSVFKSLMSLISLASGDQAEIAQNLALLISGGFNLIDEKNARFSLQSSNWSGRKSDVPAGLQRS